MTGKSNKDLREASRPLRLGILSRQDAPLLGYLLQNLLDRKVTVSAILLDSRPVSEKGRQIFRARTEGAFPSIPLSTFESAQIPFFFVQNHNAPETQRLVKTLSLDLLLNGGTPRILTAELLRAPRLGVLNCHPGLLPAFRGCTCVEWAVYLDEPVGSTVHYMDEGIDHGQIVMSEPLAIGRADDYVQLRIKSYRHNLDLMARGAKKIMESGLGPCDFQAQDEGRYFKVIEPDKMRTVVEKLAKGQYKYQL